jgi:glycosyltransferase involved in cell wall biosynthesis
VTALGISIVIATRDRPAELGRCLDGVLAGNRQPLETIVVDQGAGPEGAQAVAERKDDAVLVHETQAGRGLSRSRNAGYMRSSGSAIAFTDDDCVPAASWLSAIESALARGADAVTGPMLPLEPEASGLRAVASRTSTVRHDYRGRTVLPWGVGTGANVTVRREWLSRIGGYDERLGVGSPGRAGEDIDLIHRLLRAGASIRYEPEAVVYHARQTSERRRASRSGYGWGIGTCCGLWVRQRDAWAAAIFGRWLLLRGGLFGRAVARGRWGDAHEELLVLWGTVGGVLHGIRTRGRSTGSP